MAGARLPLSAFAMPFGALLLVSAVVTISLRWLDADRPPGHPAYAYLLLAAVTALIALIAAWTVAAAARDTLLPPPLTH